MSDPRPNGERKRNPMNALSRNMKWIQVFLTISLLVCSLGPMTAATTIRISNGFIGAYGNLNLVW